MVFFVGGNEITHFHVGLFLSSGNGFSRRGEGGPRFHFFNEDMEYFFNWKLEYFGSHPALSIV